MVFGLSSKVGFSPLSLQYLGLFTLWNKTLSKPNCSTRISFTGSGLYFFMEHVTWLGLIFLSLGSKSRRTPPLEPDYSTINSGAQQFEELISGFRPNSTQNKIPFYCWPNKAQICLNILTTQEFQPIPQRITANTDIHRQPPETSPSTPHTVPDYNFTPGTSVFNPWLETESPRNSHLPPACNTAKA